MGYKGRRPMMQMAIVVSGAVAMAGVVYQAIYQFHNPDMTPTRVALNQWPVGVVIVVAGMACVMLQQYRASTHKKQP